MGTQNDQQPADLKFARGMSGPFGQFSEPVKTFLDEETHRRWLRLCNEKETTSSELLRDCIFLLTHGKTPAELTAEDRRSFIAAQGLTQVLPVRA